MNAFDFPLRFSDSGDVAKTSSPENAAAANVRNAVLIMRGGVPMQAYGTSVSPFEQDPAIVGSVVGNEAAQSVAMMDPKIILDGNPVVSSSEHTLTMIFSYLVTTRSEGWQTVAVPVFLGS